MNPFLLLALGFILIFIEFYIPGAVMGIIGGILLLVSLVLFAMQSDSPLAVSLYVIGMGVSLGLIVKFALWRIRHAKPENSIYSNNAQDKSYLASTFDRTAIGKKGIVLTDLKPGGYILIEGKQHQAVSQSGYVVKGSEVLIIGGEGESLIVKSIKKEPL